VAPGVGWATVMLLAGSALAETATSTEEAKKKLESRRIELENAQSRT
jgi:hypothetical protein